MTTHQDQNVSCLRCMYVHDVSISLHRLTSKIADDFSFVMVKKYRILNRKVLTSFPENIYWF